MVIVIDGPAGSGKSSTARAAAKKLNIEYLDSGALYRAVTLLFNNSSDKSAFFEKLGETSISFRFSNERFEVFIDGEDVTTKLRTAPVSQNVSTVAAMPRVRSFVNTLMQKAVREGIYIADGRDLGSAVFPDANLKFYMKADLNERVKRRLAELKGSDADITAQEVRRNIELRDKKDSSRKNDPLKKAPDAIVVDTSEMEFEEQVHRVCSVIQEKANINLN